MRNVSLQGEEEEEEEQIRSINNEQRKGKNGDSSNTLAMIEVNAQLTNRETKRNIHL